MQLVDTSLQAGIIMLDNAFRPSTSVQDDIASVLETRKADFSTEFDGVVDDVKDMLVTIQDDFQPHLDAIDTDMVTDATTKMNSMSATMNASGADSATITGVNDLISGAIIDFNTGVGSVIDDINAAFEGYSYLLTSIDDAGNAIKTLVDSEFDSAVSSVVDTKLAANDMNKLINPVMNYANKELNLGLKEIQRDAFSEVDAAKKGLQRTIRKDIKSMKRTMEKEVGIVAGQVEELILSDTTLDTAAIENLILDLEGQLNALIEMVDTDFRDDLYSEIDTSAFKKDSSELVKEKVNQMKTAIKEDKQTVKDNFVVPTDTAGPTIEGGDSTFADALTAGSTVQIVITQADDSNNTATGSMTMEADQDATCDFGPSDDLKYRFLCEIAGVFEYGNESYTCVDTNLPTSLFCASTV